MQFMDAMNRTLGLQLLIEMSLDNPARQLILLSPQVRRDPAMGRCTVQMRSTPAEDYQGASGSSLRRLRVAGWSPPGL